MSEKRLIILDGYSLLYRAFFATRYLSTSDGRPTNALHGFVGMLFTLIETQKPDAVLIAFDSPGKTFRHVEYAEYKGTRKETAPELIAQLPVARELVSALHMPYIELTGYEADDIVGTVSLLAEQNGYRTSIVTGDLDALQLVDDCVQVVTNKTGVSDVVIYTPDAVRARYGFDPKYVPDYKAIVGDTSDNIPGVPGIGEKGATALIQKFGTVEEMLERFDEVDPKYAKKIEPGREQMLKSKWLATIDRHVPLTYDFAPYRITQSQLESSKAMLESLEMRSHVRKITSVLAPYVEGYVSSQAPIEVTNERIEVQSEQSRNFDELSRWAGDRTFAMYVEPPTQASMFDEQHGLAYVAIGKEVRKTTDKDALRLFAQDPSRAIVHSGKNYYKQIPHTLVPPKFDSFLGGFVLQSGRSSYAVRDLIQGYLEIAPPTTAEELAASMFLLEPAMRERLDKESQTKVLDEVELPLVPILAEMEGYGIGVSRDFLMEFSKSLQVEIERTAKQIFEMAGQKFNIGSPKQLGELLFEKMNLPGPKKTKTGYATGAEILQVLAPSNPICTEILNWRELTKLKSTYADSLPRMIGDDNRIHTNYNQAGAATGRLSSNDPNLQNIPIRTELGRQIRKAFIAAPGYRLGSFDYSQIELRLLALLCHDDALVDAFQKRVDVHTVTAALMFGLSNDQVSKEQRRLAKMLNYAVLYGVTDFGLANQLGGGFSVSEAKVLIQQYFERFPKVKAFTESVIQEARQKGFTSTLIGRRRYFPDIHAANRNERMYAERQAVNAPIQGAAADMIKIAMIHVRKNLGLGGTRMLLQVHDELVFEVEGTGEGLFEPVRHQMEDALPLDVPVEVDAKVGENWSEMKPIERR